MKYLVLLVVICTTGCFAAQYDAINDEANAHMHALDNQCRQNMTEWCRTQYMLVQRQREQELNDLEARRHHAAQILSDMNRSNNVQCTTSYVGSYAYTNCH